MRWRLVEIRAPTMKLYGMDEVDLLDLKALLTGF